MTILGVAGLSIQLFIATTTIATTATATLARHGIIRSFLVTQPLFTLTYALAPFLALVSPKSLFLWPCIAVGTALHATARTYALLATTMLLDTAVADQTRATTSLRGTAHGVVAVISALCRTHAAVVAGMLYGWSEAIHVVGLVWWGCAALSAVGWGLSFWVLHWL